MLACQVTVTTRPQQGYIPMDVQKICRLYFIWSLIFKIPHIIPVTKMVEFYISLVHKAEESLDWFQIVSKGNIFFYLFNKVLDLTLNIPSLGRQRCLPSWGPRRNPWFFFCNFSTVWCGRLLKLGFLGFWNYNSVIQALLVSNISCLFISTEVSQ